MVEDVMSTEEERKNNGTRRHGQPLASELGGDVPCVRCRYNLKGLSIRAVCPECGTPLRVTLLAVVDPLASELRPIIRPRSTAFGVVVWSISALAACMCAWAAGIVGVLAWDSEMARAGSALRLSVVGLAALSGIGAAVLVKPHKGIPRQRTVMALMGVGLYVPLVALLWWTAYRSTAVIQAGNWGGAAPVGADALAGIGLDVLLIAILILLRPNARLLAARSLLMRTGRVDRQTMRAVAFSLVLNIVGNGLGWLAGHKPGGEWDLLLPIGGLLTLGGCLFFTAGLIGIVVDCWRMRGVVASPPLSFIDLLGPAQTPERPSRDFVR